MAPKPTGRHSACRACDDVYGLDATDRCPHYTGTSDSNGNLYCANCGHIVAEHPIGRRTRRA